jgi:hypothetical protein
MTSNIKNHHDAIVSKCQNLILQASYIRTRANAISVYTKEISSLYNKNSSRARIICLQKFNTTKLFIAANPELFLHGYHGRPSALT